MLCCSEGWKVEWSVVVPRTEGVAFTVPSFASSSVRCQTPRLSSLVENLGKTAAINEAVPAVREKLDALTVLK